MFEIFMALSSAAIHPAVAVGLLVAILGRHYSALTDPNHLLPPDRRAPYFNLPEDDRPWENVPVPGQIYRIDPQLIEEYRRRNPWWELNERNGALPDELRIGSAIVPDERVQVAAGRPEALSLMLNDLADLAQDPLAVYRRESALLTGDASQATVNLSAMRRAVGGSDQSSNEGPLPPAPPPGFHSANLVYDDRKGAWLLIKDGSSFISSLTFDAKAGAWFAHIIESKTVNGVDTVEKTVKQLEDDGTWSTIETGAADLISMQDVAPGLGRAIGAAASPFVERRAENRVRVGFRPHPC